jgi:hypothetical protein
MQGKLGVAAGVAALTLFVPFAGVALAGNDKTPPGQEKKAENAAPQPAAPAPAKPEKKSKPAKKAKPAKPSKPAKPAKPAKSAKPANPHAKAGKTTICHSTGSASNPFVTITVSNNALKAHARHHDGRDLIPAPAAGCPKGEKAKDAPATKPAGTGKPKPERVTICHATGSTKNPFVKITIAEPAVAAHKRHQDGRDIIPAPEGDCPAPAPAPAAAAQASPRDAVAPAAAAPAAAAPAPAPAGQVLGEVVSGGPGAADPDLGVGPAEATDTRESGADTGLLSSLPFTGLDTWLLLVAGLGLLLAGIAGRRAAVSRG